MFSYRHGFHAGNHADILKHMLFLEVIAHFQQKDAGFWVVDTHAGAGLYDLTGVWANKRAEYQDGIARIWDLADAPPMVQRYKEAIAKLNPDNTLTLYPGSPWLALQSLRAQDKVKLYEQLSAEFDVLRKNLAQYPGLPPRAVTAEQHDGYAGLKSILPPASKRAVTLIDPSYEDKRDYRFVAEAMAQAIQRFPTGCYLIWYPRVNRREVEQLVRQLKRLKSLQPLTWLDVNMTVCKAPPDGHGLFGSGMFIVNPPFRLGQQIRETLPWLTPILAQDTTARWQLEAGTSPT
uniref:23S rRNA (adenine(2030)-N(6))-methyltransferase RlmJ n=1 Tax=Orrella sp. TaxID=1921583 RepID=UPI0040480DE5